VLKLQFESDRSISEKRIRTPFQSSIWTALRPPLLKIQ